MGRRKSGRAVNGMLVLMKPEGLSSNRALQTVRFLLDANKAGHTGSLDPLATGVLPLCFGEATKFSQYLLDADKGYTSTFRLGVSTTTCDCEGEVMAQADASALTAETVEAALAQFRGDLLQVPPMVSALKHQGQPLYKLARAGKTIEREARPVRIFELTLLDFRPGQVAEADVRVACSKGTYIRSLAADLGQLLGVGGHVSRLHRTRSGGFDESQCVTLEQLRSRYDSEGAASLDALLLPVDAPVATLPQLQLAADSDHYFLQGQAVMDLRVYRLGRQGDTVRVCREDGTFLGLGEITDDGCVAPRRLVATGT